MAEFDSIKLEKAVEYVKRMAEGKNPVNNEMVEEDSVINNPNVVSCQFCGRYFIPKTRKVTKYCDSIVRNNRTCKQVAPGLKKRERDAAHLVTSEFERIKDMLFHRRDRMGGNKNASVIDLTDDEFVRWLEAATDARNRYLAGELTEKEALAIIYVPKKNELIADNSLE